MRPICTLMNPLRQSLRAYAALRTPARICLMLAASLYAASSAWADDPITFVPIEDGLTDSVALLGYTPPQTAVDGLFTTIVVVPAQVGPGLELWAAVSDREQAVLALEYERGAILEPVYDVDPAFGAAVDEWYDNEGYPPPGTTWYLVATGSTPEALRSWMTGQASDPLTWPTVEVHAWVWLCWLHCDWDEDGIPNYLDNCPGVSNNQSDTDGDGIGNECDTDIDGDGISNGLDLDADGDGIPNGQDPDVDGDGQPNYADSDIDGDGLANGHDPDIDGDGLINSEDFDMDGDGVANGQDDDVDGDDLDNGEDGDVDADGVANGQDNDVDSDFVNNGYDADVDGDGLANGNDPDIDGDGLTNGQDLDADGDGIPNGQDSDADGDGLHNADPAEEDIDGDGLSDGHPSETDVDGDGVPNTADADIDGDSLPNSMDDDIDGDGLSNNSDADADNDVDADTVDPDPDGPDGGGGGGACEYTPITVEFAAFMAMSAAKLPLGPTDSYRYTSGDNRTYGNPGPSNSRVYMRAQISMNPQAAHPLNDERHQAITIAHFDSPPGTDILDTGQLHCGENFRYIRKQAYTAGCVEPSTGWTDILKGQYTDAQGRLVRWVEFVSNAFPGCLPIVFAMDARIKVEFRQGCFNGVLTPLEFRVSGKHDGFPWYEVRIDGFPVYIFNACFPPDGSPNGPLDLVGFADHFLSSEWRPWPLH